MLIPFFVCPSLMLNSIENYTYKQKLNCVVDPKARKAFAKLNYKVRLVIEQEGMRNDGDARTHEKSNSIFSIYIMRRRCHLSIHLGPPVSFHTSNLFIHLKELTHSLCFPIYKGARS